MIIEKQGRRFTLATPNLCYPCAKPEFSFKAYQRLVCATEFIVRIPPQWFLY